MHRTIKMTVNVKSIIQLIRSFASTNAANQVENDGQTNASQLKSFEGIQTEVELTEAEVDLSN
jgi:hypothetical protein